MPYHKMFLDYLINNLLSLYSSQIGGKVSKSDLIVTELDDLNKIIINEKVKRIIYFKQFILSEEHCTHLE